MESSLTIGKLAAAAGVNLETIRYYQRRGLLETPTRPPGGQRRYGPDQAARVRFIKRAQALGFTLDEVGGLLDLDAARACDTTRALAERKLTLIEHKLADLEAMRQALSGLLGQCEAATERSGCPIIDTLARD